MLEGKIVHENSRFKVFKRNGTLHGEEKPHKVYTGNRGVFIQNLGNDTARDMMSGLNAIEIGDIIQPGDAVAIKVNIGGGINGVLSSYTDPDLLEGVVRSVRDAGGKPFVCEADMRGHQITPKLLETRGYTRACKQLGVPFVNLSVGTRVSFKFLGIPMPVELPWILLQPGTKIISFAPPKHHWECGITCSQKNMYGAIADYKKSRFHRKYELIDHVVAAAARVMKPDISIIATKQLGAGLGPHFCIPFNFHKAIIARDMLSCDKFCAEVLGYPVGRIKYFQINAQGKDIDYTLLPGSTSIDPRVLGNIRKNYIDPKAVELYKKTLFIQYFVPSALQFHTYHYFEWILTWMNHKMFVPRGDPEIKA
ncbi:MAG: DUF362 domain-containing protein [Promethearchaeota archaeon]